MPNFDAHSPSKRYLTKDSQMTTTNRDPHKITQRWVVLSLLIWGIVVFTAAYYGLFTKVTWLTAPLVVAGITIPTVLYYRNQHLRAYISSIDLKYLILFHLWRIPAGLTFLYYGSQHLLPHQFVFNAGYGDLLVGFLVPVVLMLRGGVNKYIVFELIGLLDFVVAVGTGLTFNILRVPLQANIATFPIALIPLYGVCVTGALSIMTLDILLGKRFKHPTARF